jgi:Co/Zn/Cd efflux system component
MESCCTDKASALAQLRDGQASTLRFVLAVNAAMFVAELVAGLLAGSVALVADSLDMLTDALVYGFSLYVIDRGSVWKARAALLKAGVMGFFGAVVLAQLIYKLVVPAVPGFETMGVVGGLALAANSACFAVLWRHRADDLNMRSVWLCSRNDLVANGSVLIAAWGVMTFESAWPDIIAGALVCALFLRSAWAVRAEALQVFRDSPRELGSQLPPSRVPPSDRRSTRP